MRRYNADPSHRVKLQFYGFDSPTEMTGSDSPSQVLHFVLDYLASIDRASAQEHRERIDRLLGQDSNWENPAALADPTKSVGLSPAATATVRHQPQAVRLFDVLAAVSTTGHLDR